MKKKITRYFEAGTGEVYYEREEDVRFERFSDEKGYLFATNNNKVIHILKPGLPDLVPSEIGYLFLLACKLTRAGFISMNNQELCDYLNIHRSSLHRLLQQFTAKGLMKREGKLIFLNPLYFSATNYISAAQFKMFAEELIPFIPAWAIRKFTGFPVPKSP